MFTNETKFKQMLIDALGVQDFPQLGDALREITRKLDEVNQDERDFSALQEQLFELKRRAAQDQIANNARLAEAKLELDEERQRTDLAIKAQEQNATLAIEKQKAKFEMEQKARAEGLRIKADDAEREQEMKDRELKQLLSITEENLKVEALKEQLKLQAEAKDLEVKLQRDYHAKIRAELKEAKADMRYIYDGVMKCLPNVNLDAQRVTSSHPLPASTTKDVTVKKADTANTADTASK